MARNDQPIQLIIAKRLRPSAVRQTRSIADWVVDIVGLVDLAAGRGELMQDAGDLTGGIIGVVHIRLEQLQLWSSSRINKMKGITMEQISFTTVRQLDLICQKIFPIDTSHDWNHLPFREHH